MRLLLITLPLLAQTNWPAYLGDKATAHYSPLAQINKQNVKNLKQAWTFDTGDKGEFQSNGLVINGVLYTASPNRKVFAINAKTSQEIWQFNPANHQQGPIGRRQRGVTYWQEKAFAKPSSIRIGV